MLCPDCNGNLEIPVDAFVGEVITCPSCGLELEIVKIEDGTVNVREVTIEGEDWGE